LKGKQDFLNIFNGFYILINNRTYKPLTKYNGISVQSGKVTNIGISKTFTNLLDDPYSNCRKNLAIKSSDTIYYKLTSLISTYSRRLTNC
jgi:hypothetical protein